MDDYLQLDCIQDLDFMIRDIYLNSFGVGIKLNI